jgi:ABC-type multidrug transport system permease subunit
MIIQKKQKSLFRNRTQRIGTDILLGALILVAISGFILLYMKMASDSIVLKLNLWWWAFIHRISALASHKSGLVSNPVLNWAISPSKVTRPITGQSPFFFTLFLLM